MNRPFYITLKRTLGILMPLAPLALISGLVWEAFDLQRKEMDRMQDAAYAQRLVSEITESALRARILTDNAAGYGIALEHAGFALEALKDLPRNESLTNEIGRLDAAVSRAALAEGSAVRIEALAQLEQAASALDAGMADSLESEGERAAGSLRILRGLTGVALAALLLIMLSDRLRLLGASPMRLRMGLPEGPALLQLVSGTPATGYRFTPKRRWR